MRQREKIQALPRKSKIVNKINGLFGLQGLENVLQLLGKRLFIGLG